MINRGTGARPGRSATRDQDQHAQRTDAVERVAAPGGYSDDVRPERDGLIGVGGVDVDVPERYVRPASLRDGRKGGKEPNGDDS